MRFCSADTACGNGGVRVFLYFLLYFGGFSPFVSWCCPSLLPFVLGPLPVITFVCFSSVLLNFCCVFQFCMLASVVLFQPVLLIGLCFLGLAQDFEFVVSTQPVWFVCLHWAGYLLNVSHSARTLLNWFWTCCTCLCSLQTSVSLMFPAQAWHIVWVVITSFYTPQHSSTSCLRFLAFLAADGSSTVLRNLSVSISVIGLWSLSLNCLHVPLSYRPFTGPSANVHCLSSVKLHWSLLWLFAVDVHGLILLSSAGGWFRLHGACAFCFFFPFLILFCIFYILYDSPNYSEG